MATKDRRVVQDKITVRVFSYSYRKFLKRTEGGAILDDEWHLDFWDGNFLCLTRLGLNLEYRRLFIRGYFLSFCLAWRWRHALDFWLCLCHLSQEAEFGATVCKGQNIPIFEIGFLGLFTIDQSAVGAVVDQLEAVAFSCDLGMFAGNNREIFRELHLARRMAANRDNRFRELLDFTFQRPMYMNKLHNNEGWTFHMMNASVPKFGGNP